MADASEALQAIEAGQTVTVSRTVGEADLCLFSALSGDFSPVHVNEEYVKSTPFGRRIAHGVLALAYMSWAVTEFLEAVPHPSVSYGYDRVRFIKPVYIGDTLTVEYRVGEKIPEKNQLRDQVTVTNQHGEVVAVATHIVQFL